MVEVTLVGVRVELPTNQPIVLLKERDGGRFLPIWIGAVEATAIAFALQGVVTQRPMTHDLLKNIVDELGVTIEGIDITELRQNLSKYLDSAGKEQPFPDKQRPMRFRNLSVVAFIQNDATQEVLQAVQVPVREE